VSIAVYDPDGFALQIFRDRYAIHAEETFGQACERVSRSIADAEMGTKRDEYFARFLDILQTNRFSPGGRIWRGAGRQRGQMLNCLQGDTLVHTKEYGLIPIKLLAGTNADVLSNDGVFRHAVWFSGGVQQLYKITLKNGDTLFATAEHEWPVAKKGFGIVKKKTTELMGEDNKRGAYCLLVQHRDSFEIKNEGEYKQGIRHGLVFGDGSLYCNDRLSRMPQFGNSKHLVEDHFNDITHWPSINATVATKLPASFKKLPCIIDETQDYLRGFVAGWIAADGCVDSRGMVMGYNKDLETIRQIRRICAEVGIATSSIKLDRDTNPFNGESSTLYKLTFAKQSFFNEGKQDNKLILKNKHRDNFATTAEKKRNRHSVKVVGVEPTDRFEEVFCCEESDTHTFVVEEGCYLTGNCFVWTDDLDSREGWGDALRAVTIISGTGGGIGLNFSRVRPRGSAIRGTGGEATGAVSLMRCINAVCNELREGGGRRSALMFCLKYDHPDLMEFLEAKLDKGELSNANISVCIDDAFLKLLDEEGEVVFRWQGEERGRVAAKDIWDKIVHNAWESGDPGVLNIGLANTMNTVSYRHDLVSTNPCFTGEMRLHTGQGMLQLKTLADTGGVQNIQVTTDDRCISSVLQGTTIRPASQVEKTGKQQQIYALTTSHGHKIRCTEYHEFITPTGRRPLKMLGAGSELYLQSGEGAWGCVGDYGDGLIIGSFTGDGTTAKTDHGIQMCLDYWNEDKLCDKVLDFVNAKIADGQLTQTTRNYGPVVSRKCSEPGKRRISSIRLSRYFYNKFCADIEVFKNRVPELVWSGSRELVKGYLAGLFQAGGSVQLKDRGTKGTLSVRLSQSNFLLLQDVQILLGNFGIVSSVYKRRDQQYRNLPDGHGGLKPFLCKTQYELIINRPNAIVFEELIGFAGDKQKQLTQLLDQRGRECRKPERFTTKIKSIKKDGIEDVYCLNQPSHHCIVVNGVVTGQCGEIWMPPYDCCCLGAVNLHTHVVDGDIDWDLLEETVAMSVRFLDDVLDQNNYPMSIIQETCQKYRRVGLGVMGLHDMLLELGLKYSSKAAREVVDKVMDFVKKQAYHASITLAIEKGSFHAFDVDQHIKTGFVKKCLPRRHHRLIKEHGLRNCALLTIAPTGTISIVAGCSSGIEPLFQPVYERRFNKHKDMHDDSKRDRAVEVVVHPLLKQFLESRKSTKHFQGAHDITPEAHLAMQAICQKHIDNSISKTVNLPTDHPVDQLSKEMRQYIGELKGITVYRDGSKGESPLVPVPLSEAKQHLGKMEAEAAVNDCPSGACETTKGGS